MTHLSESRLAEIKGLSVNCEECKAERKEECRLCWAEISATEDETETLKAQLKIAVKRLKNISTIDPEIITIHGAITEAKLALREMEKLNG